MNIPEKGPLQSSPVSNTSAERKQHPPASESWVQEKITGKNTADWNRHTDDLSGAGQGRHGLFDGRGDRIMLLKRQLEAGTYRVKGHRIAVNMIDEALENNQVIKHIDAKA
jgi:anti-sigma28 factor (negative regulator of flagellin synthesis)